MRHWLRRQDPFTRGLLVSVVALAALVVLLIVPRFNRSGDEPREARGPAAREPAATTRPRSASRPPPAPEPQHAAVKAPAAAPRTARATPEPAGGPRAAILIDDLGQSLSHLQQLGSLGLPLSIAVIPGLPASARTVAEASRLGIEMLLHQPMEPREEGGKNAGDGVLLTSMTAEALRARIRASLAAVPGAVGVNNHMGSRFTEDVAGLGALMAELKAHNLFWLDSRTTPATRGAEVARAMGVPTLERDVFIDAEVDADFIRGQLRKLLETARSRGAAVGIGHPHPETIAALREMRGELLASGVALVPVSALVKPPAAASATALAALAPHKGRGEAATAPGLATP